MIHSNSFNNNSLTLFLDLWCVLLFVLFFIPLSCLDANIAGSGRESTLLPDLGAIHAENNRDRNHQHCDASNQCRRPLDAYVLKHLLREERETRSHERPEHRISRKGRGRTAPVSDTPIEGG